MKDFFVSALVFDFLTINVLITLGRVMYVWHNFCGFR